MRWKTAVFAFALLSFAGGVVASAQDIPLTVLGNDNEIQARLGYRPGERTEIGAAGLWRDRNNAVGVGVYVTYDVMHEQEFNIFGLSTVPATIPIGGIIGGQSGDDLPSPQVADAFVSLLTAIMFGDKNVRLGFEYQYALDENNLGWSDLGSVPDQHKLFFLLQYRF